jgi:serine/threonine protein kinase
MKTLGDGNFAVVKQAKLKNTDTEYAIKIIDKSKMKVGFDLNWWNFSLSFFLSILVIFRKIDFS